jgi:N-acetylglutamate synthase-like GNAT family acetyltransferase
MTSAAAAMLIRRAVPLDWPGIEHLLQERELPVAGASDHLSDFLIAVRELRLLGCAGLEQYGDVALLRSVAVVGAEEGRGVGEALVRRTLSTAAAQGVREVYLLTTTAAGYFPRFGFQVVERSALPAALEASTELRGACPASATAMRLTLEGGPRG